MCRWSSATGSMPEILPHAARSMRHIEFCRQTGDLFGRVGRYARGHSGGSMARRPACDSRRGPDQVVRGRARAAGHRPVGAARDGAGRAGTQRRGQDDRGPDLDHAAAAGRGRAVVDGYDVVRERGRGPPVDRAGRAVGGHPGRADRPGEPGDHRAAVPPALAAGPQPGRRAAGAVRPERRGRPAGQDLLRRHAAAPGPGREPGRAAAGAVPRRADHGPGPAVEAGHVGHHPVPGRRRDDASCSPPSTWTRPTSWPTRSSSSTTARSSPRARPRS